MSEWRRYKEKSAKLESIISTLSTPSKRKFISTVSDKQFENILSNCLIQHLKGLYESKQYPQFYSLLFSIIEPHMNDQDFMDWIASKFSYKWRGGTFIKRLEKWHENHFLEIRGRSKLSPHLKQLIYETWLDNCINSTDNRNGRAMVNIFTCEYEQKFGDLLDEKVEKMESVNKRGRKVISVNRMISTCSVRKLIEKIKEQGYNASLSNLFL